MLVDSRPYAAGTPNAPAIRRALGAVSAGVVVVGLVGAAIHSPTRAAGSAQRATDAGPSGGVVAPTACPSGVLDWVVSSVRYRADPLNGHDVTLTISGTVRNDTGTGVSVVMAEDAVTAAPGPGVTVYPVYLTLAGSDLFPGDTSTFTGSSAELGVAVGGLSRPRVTYTTMWDSPQYAGRCGPPAESGG